MTRAQVLPLRVRNAEQGNGLRSVACGLILVPTRKYPLGDIFQCNLEILLEREGVSYKVCSSYFASLFFPLIFLKVKCVGQHLHRVNMFNRSYQQGY